MKKILFAGMFSVWVFGTAYASDNIYTETETTTTWETVTIEQTAPSAVRYASSADVKPCRPSCNTCGGCVKRGPSVKPVRVKTHTEVIDHYQVYQPVTVYQPAGTYTERRMVPVKSCNKCGM